MARPGRKSAAALATPVAEVPVAPSQQRQPPPASLTAAERAVWLEAVNDQPAGAFTDVHRPQLEMYCRHVVRSRILAEEILRFDHAWLADDDGLKRYDQLLKMAEREGRAASMHATRLRITRQSVDQQTIARMNMNAPKAKKPWEAGK